MEKVQLLCAEIIADHDAGSDRNTVEEKDHDIHDHGGGAHRSKRLLAYKLADHNGIDGIVEHLEYIAQQERKGERDQMPEDPSFGHIPRCGVVMVMHNQSRLSLRKNLYSVCTSRRSHFFESC